MKMAIMQPYLFPYLGYFKLIKSVDKLIFLDNANFIKKGWINRNYILLDGKRKLFTIPLKDASQNRLINEIAVFKDENGQRKIKKMIHSAYHNSLNFKAIFPLFLSVLDSGESICDLAASSIEKTCEYLGFNVIFEFASSYDTGDLKGVDKILKICSLNNAREYFNLPGGKALYDPMLFKEKGIKLNFIEYDDENSQPLSVLHHLMNQDMDKMIL